MTEIDRLRAINAELLEMLMAAQAHLEYCGWGDAFERQCARDEGLPEKITAAIARAELPG